jgi:NFU1 iron-sulfur cluster scaffold homolog, mitochondrial
MGIAEEVAAALERSVLPSVIARGGSLRVLDVEGGVVTLEMSGSPGATLPLLPRLDALVRAAVPEVTDVRVLKPGEEPPGEAAGGTHLGERVRRVLDAEINPAISAHRGRVVLVNLDQGWIRIRMEGSCQGCSLAEVTLRQGIEPLLRERVPEMVGLKDVTDHGAGTNPFFSPAKR